MVGCIVMKKRTIVLFICCSIFLFNPNVVSAHPGRTDSSGCHKCNKNCAQWGLSNGEYHCHSGGLSSNNNSSSNSNNQTIIPKLNPKSSDNTLKLITIDGENIEVSDKMSYKTKKEKIEILVETNDDKATYDISNSSLMVGKNTINIKVTAENDDVKNYSLVVDREKLSNNTNIKIIVADEEITFSLGKAKVYVSSDSKDLDYKYELEDVNSTVAIEGDKNLKFGENIVNFTVKAEDGTETKYELIVSKPTKTDETMSAVLGFATMGGIGYGIYYVVKKRKKK